MSVDNPQLRTSDLEGALRHAFASYTREFKEMIKWSNQALREAMLMAQEPVQGQSGEQAPRRPAAELQGAAEGGLKSTTARIVEQTFAQAKQMLEQIERSSLDIQDMPAGSEAGLPVFDAAAQTETIDQIAASDSMIAHAADALNLAMETVIQSMTFPSPPNPRG